MNFLNYPIFYLTAKDFDAKGNFINNNTPKNLPMLIMMQTANCSWCQKAKPAYQKLAYNSGYRITKGDRTFKKLANKYKLPDKDQTIFITTIQSGGQVKGEENIKDLINKIDPKFEGFPHYLIIYKGKKYTYNGNRSEKDLRKFTRDITK